MPGQSHAAERGEKEVGVALAIAVDDLAAGGEDPERAHVAAERAVAVVALAMHVGGDHAAERDERGARSRGHETVFAAPRRAGCSARARLRRAAPSSWRRRKNRSAQPGTRDLEGLPAPAVRHRHTICRGRASGRIAAPRRRDPPSGARARAPGAAPTGQLGAPATGHR